MSQTTIPLPTTAVVEYENVLKDVLNDDGTLQESLGHFGVLNLYAFLSLTPGEIDLLTKPPPTERSPSGVTTRSSVAAQTTPSAPIRVPLSLAERSLLKAFKGYVWWYQLEHDGGLPTFMLIERSEFDAFRISTHWNPDILFSRSLPVSSPTSSTNRLATRSPAEDFRRGVKRDPSHYLPLREDKQWDSWRRSTISTARAHGCEDVFNPNYKPRTSDDMALFVEKQKFVYSVFESVLKTDMGKYIVRQHEDDFNAQEVFRKLEIYALTSTQATLDASSLLTYLTSAKFDSKWNGTSTSFILHWCDKLRTHEDMLPSKDHFSDSVKMTLLQNTVDGVDDLNQVKLQSAHDVTHGQRKLKYEQYKSLLLSAAAAYDTKRGLARPSLPRRIQQHDLVDTSMDAPNPSLPSWQVQEHDSSDSWQLPDTSSTFGIDTDLDTLHIHAATSQPRRPPRSSRQPPYPRLTRDQWYSLPPADQATWDQLSPQSKAIILGTTPPSPSPPPSGSTPSSGRRSRINLHDISAADYLDIISIHSHQSSLPDTPTGGPSSAITFEDPSADTSLPSANPILAMATQRAPPSSLARPPPSTPASSTLPGDVRRVLGTKGNRSTNVHRLHYKVSAHKASSFATLVDRGANGGIAGDDVRVIFKAEHPRRVDVSGIDNHQMTDLPIVTAGGVVQSQRGPVIAILNQYAYTGHGKSIHSSAQLEWFCNAVDDRSMTVGGKQCIQTVDGYVHLLSFHMGLPYVKMRPYTDDEWDTLPHVVWTSDTDWDPSVLDPPGLDEDTWYDAVSDLPDGPLHPSFDEFGNYRYRSTGVHFIDDGERATASCDLAESVEDASAFHTPHFFFPDAVGHQIQCQLHQSDVKTPDYNRLRPFFLHATADVVKRTFAVTTQYARSLSTSTLMKKTFRSPFPALNVHRRREAVATDTVYSDVPAIDNGSTAAQIFVGRDTLVTDAYPVKTDKQFVNTLEDNIRQRGAMDKLLSDGAKAEISNRVKDILRYYSIDDWQSEPHNQHQNKAERRWGVIKPLVNLILKRTGAPACTWLLVLLYVIYILNRTATPSLNWKTPLQALNGDEPDISAIMQYQFWEPVYYRVSESDISFPSNAPEKLGRFVGFAESVGHALTFKVLTDDTQKVISRSVLRSTQDTASQQAKFDDNDTVPEILKSKHDRRDGDNITPMPTIDVESLIGRTFLMPRQDDGQRYRAKIVEAIDDHERGLSNEKVRIRFRCTVNDEEFEEIVSYNELIDNISKDETEEGLWKFKSISAHQGPLSPSHPAYNGSKYNVLVNWETGESTFEPLATIAADDPITCAIYAKENDLLELDGWRQFKRIARRQQKLLRMTNQAKLKSFRTTPVYKFGFLVPRNHAQAVELDIKNGNTRWQDAEALEVKQVEGYETFIDKGKDAIPPAGYKKIRCHMVYDVKHDGRHKARLVAGGHLTDTPVESVYSSVVSLKGLRLVVFLAELNGLEVWSTDIGNAYLEAKTKEKVYIVAGPEFGDREGNILVFNKALYGLKSSGLRWHEKFADTLRSMGFVPSKAENDIWIRRVGNVYEYIATYVDDLAICSKDPQSIIDTLTKTYKYKLKGTGPLSYHLGCDYHRDADGTLCSAPKKYIDRIIDGYVQMFGQSPKEATSPLVAGDHPELDTSPELDEEGVKQYQSLIGSLQWAISLGRFDIATAVMSMSSFRASPRVGHLDRLKRIYGYLSKMRHATIRIRTMEPDYSDIPEQFYDWTTSVYGDVKELLPLDAPEPLGKCVTFTTYVDANLYHDMMTGRSVTGIIHLINQTPFDWYSKKQSTVETATYGSEFVAARIAIDQIIEHRTMLRYLGVPVREKTYMFGDNKSVVDSSSIPQSKLHKRHTALSYHRVREAIAAGIVSFTHLPGSMNPADILSKHWAYTNIWSMLQALLFFPGDTSSLIEEDN